MVRITTQRQILLVFATAVIVRLGFHVISGFTADEAFITFRYADNLASGLGLVYNEGQRILGTATPLYTFIIALFRLCSFPVVPAALLISVLSAGITAVILLRLAQSLRFTHLAVLPAIAYLLFPRSLPAETAGMEAALFTCLTTAAIYYHHRRETIYSLAAATLAVLTRPEGVILLFILIIDLGIHHRQAILTYLAVPISLILPWIAFALYYFGRVIPPSIPAKAAFFDYIDIRGPLERFIYVIGLDTVAGWALFLLAVGGAYWLNRKQNFGWIAISWLLALILYITASGTHVSSWYVAPLYPMYLLLAGAAAPFFFEVARFTPRQFRAVSRWAIAALALTLAIGAIGPALYYQRYQNYLDVTHKAIGRYLLRHASQSDLVAAEDIGYIGYYSHLKILDRDGLISPGAIPYIRSGSQLQLILDYRPTWVVTNTANPGSDFSHETPFQNRYALEQQFGGEGGDQYDLWRLREQ